MMKMVASQVFLLFVKLEQCLIKECFFQQDDIGLSAVVGSAVYNVMFVISLCALFAGSVSLLIYSIFGCLQYLLHWCVFAVML
jgi:Ca2+/Na+ antiporter